MLRPAWPWQLASVRHNVQLCSNLHCLEKYLKQWRPWTSLSRLYLCRALLCPRRPHAAALQPLQWRASSWFPAEDCSKLSLLLPIVGTKFAWILCRQRHRHRGEARCLNVIFSSPLPQWGSGPPCCRLCTADLIYLQLFRLRHLSQCPTSHCSTLPGLGLGPPDGSGFQVHEKWQQLGINISCASWK